MKILKRLAWFAVSVFIIFAVFMAGVKSGATLIASSCDNPDEAKTIINGRAYLCGDFDAMQQAIQQAIHQHSQDRGA